MLTIANVLTADGFTEALTLGPVPTTRLIKYVVANAAVFAQIAAKSASGTIMPWGEELLITPETNVVSDAQGMRFRSASVGVPARVVAQLLEPKDPTIGSGTPFSATLSGSGGVSPGPAAMQLQKDGVLIGTEPILNLLTGLGMKITASDDAAGTRLLAQLDQSALANVSVAVATSTVDIQNIPATYANLLVLGSIGTDNAGDLDMYLRFNNRGTVNYIWNEAKWISGVASLASSAADTHATMGFAAAAAGQFSFAELMLLIPNYTAAQGQHAIALFGGNSFNSLLGIASCLCNAAAEATNRLQFFPASNNFRAGTRFTLEGRAGT